MLGVVALKPLRRGKPFTPRGTSIPLSRLPAGYCTAVLPPRSSVSKDVLGGGVVGLGKGIFGSIVGLGGGIIAIPMLTSLGLTQHQAHGTSLPGVLVTGVMGAMSYYAHSGGASIDVPAAAVLAGSAMLSANFGAKWAHKLKGADLSKYLGYFMLLAIPLVLFKKQMAEYMAPVETIEEVDQKKEESHVDAGIVQGSILMRSPFHVVGLTALGITTGIMSGMFGVGGGILMVPMLSLAGSQQMAVATSLLAMIGPSAVGTYSHYKLGNIYWRVLPTLLIGSGVGAVIGSKISVGLTENQQRAFFAVVMVGMASRSLLKSAPKIVKKL